MTIPNLRGLDLSMLDKVPLNKKTLLHETGLRIYNIHAHILKSKASF